MNTQTTKVNLVTWRQQTSWFQEETRGKNKKWQSTANEFFRGIVFSVSREGPELYSKTVKRLGLDVSAQFKIYMI